LSYDAEQFWALEHSMPLLPGYGIDSRCGSNQFFHKNRLKTLSPFPSSTWMSKCTYSWWL